MLKNDDKKQCSGKEVAKHFVLKTCELFKDEFSMPVLDVDIKAENIAIGVDNISFLSTLSGNINTNLIFSFEKTLSKKLLDSFPYLEYTDDIEEEMMLETVAEFLNIVVGITINEFYTASPFSFSPPVQLPQESEFFSNKKFNVFKTKLILKEGSMLIIISTPIENK